MHNHESVLIIHSFKKNETNCLQNEACGRAFFAMDNVLIDDRRIHVDFSQSVAKNYKWDKKGAGDFFRTSFRTGSMGICANKGH